MERDVPSRRTVIKGRMKRTHLLVFAPGSSSEKRSERHVQDVEDTHTLVAERVLQLDTPFRAGIVHFKHGDTHDEDHEGSDQLKYACWKTCQGCSDGWDKRCVPSHNSSEFDQRFLAWVNQIAMNAPPIATAMAKPTKAPRMTWKIRRGKVEVVTTGAYL